MKISKAWANGRSLLRPSPTSDLDARLLLEHVLDKPHSYLLAHGDETLDEFKQAKYSALLARAAAGEPIPYIVGKAHFFDFELAVSPAVLIPRPETEQLVERALAWLEARPGARVVDVGTGSGCIAIAIARRCEACALTAVDLSSAALAIAHQNAARLAPEQIRFVQVNLLEGIAPPIDLVVANLPYITDDEWTRLDDAVKLHEPVLALRGGQDGLDLIRRLLQQAQTLLTTDGAIFLEIGWRQGTAAAQLARSRFPNAAVAVHQDFAGHDRIVSIFL